MFKKTLSFLLLLGTFPLCSVETVLPPVIDYGKFPAIEHGYYTSIDPLTWKLGGYAFNYAPEITPFFTHLKQEYNIVAAVETGTFLGGTTNVLSTIFKEVHTIEVYEPNYQVDKLLFQDYANVQTHFGSSETVLSQLLPSLQDKRILFYLDAHWQAFWPLLDELEVISKTHKDNCIIVIDDFKVPGRPDIPYDAYGPLECSIEYVQGKLNRVFTSYTLHYLIPKSIYSRAKLVVIPKQWKKQ